MRFVLKSNDGKTSFVTPGWVAITAAVSLASLFAMVGYLFFVPNISETGHEVIIISYFFALLAFIGTGGAIMAVMFFCEYNSRNNLPGG